MNAIVDMYRPTWATCSVCGLTSPDVLPARDGLNATCSDPKRCKRVLTGQPLGGAQWPTRSPNEFPFVDDPPRRPFTLDPGPPPEGTWRDFLPPAPSLLVAVVLPWEEEQFLFQQRVVGVA